MMPFTLSLFIYFFCRLSFFADFCRFSIFIWCHAMPPFHCHAPVAADSLYSLLISPPLPILRCFDYFLLMLFRRHADLMPVYLMPLPFSTMLYFDADDAAAALPFYQNAAFECYRSLPRRFIIFDDVFDFASPALLFHFHFLSILIRHIYHHWIWLRLLPRYFFSLFSRCFLHADIFFLRFSDYFDAIAILLSFYFRWLFRRLARRHFIIDYLFHYLFAIIFDIILMLCCIIISLLSPLLTFLCDAFIFADVYFRFSIDYFRCHADLRRHLLIFSDFIFFPLIRFISFRLRFTPCCIYLIISFSFDFSLITPHALFSPFRRHFRHCWWYLFIFSSLYSAFDILFFFFFSLIIFAMLYFAWLFILPDDYFLLSIFSFIFIETIIFSLFFFFFFYFSFIYFRYFHCRFCLYSIISEPW